MKFGRIIFNKKGRWFWCNDEFDTALELKEKDLKVDWYVAEITYPDYLNYDTKMHKVQVQELLAKPDELVPLEITQSLRDLVTNSITKRIKPDDWVNLPDDDLRKINAECVRDKKDIHAELKSQGLIVDVDKFMK